MPQNPEPLKPWVSRTSCSTAETDPWPRTQDPKFLNLCVQVSRTSCSTEGTRASCTTGCTTDPTTPHRRKPATWGPWRGMGGRTLRSTGCIGGSGILGLTCSHFRRLCSRIGEVFWVGVGVVGLGVACLEIDPQSPEEMIDPTNEVWDPKSGRGPS
jgi:hypothetical protein